MAALLMTIALSLSSFSQAGYFCNVQVSASVLLFLLSIFLIIYTKQYSIVFLLAIILSLEINDN